MRASSTLDLVRSAITMTLGSMATGIFARVDVHAGEEEDAWLLEAHALRRRCHSTIAAGALKHRRPPNHRAPRSKNTTTARYSGPNPIVLCHASRLSGADEPCVIQSWLASTIVCFKFSA